MYINTKLIEEKGFIVDDCKVLQLIHQNKSNDESNSIANNISDRQLELFYEQKLVYEVKGTKKQTSFHKIRLTSKGKKLLDNIETPKVTEGDLKMYEHLCNFYLSHEDEERVLGNQKKTKMYCAIFRNRLSLSLHEMYWLCWLFVQRYEYTKKLENIFFDSNKIRYGKFENHFEDAPLYQFYEENKQEIQKLWEHKIK